MYYKLWLSISSDFPAIPRNPSCVLVQKLLKLTLSLIPESQRSEIVREQTKKNSLRFDCISNSQVSKLQQCAQQIVDRIKQTMTKIDPNSEIVSSRECNELVIFTLIWGNYSLLSRKYFFLSGNFSLEMDCVIADMKIVLFLKN